MLRMAAASDERVGGLLKIRRGTLWPLPFSSPMNQIEIIVMGNVNEMVLIFGIDRPERILQHKKHKNRVAYLF